MPTHIHRITGERVTVTDEINGITIFDDGEELLTEIFDHQYAPMPAPGPTREA